MRLVRIVAEEADLARRLPAEPRPHAPQPRPELRAEKLVIGANVVIAFLEPAGYRALG